MNDESTFILNFRQQTRFWWTDIVASKNASHNKSWVDKELLGFSEDWRLRLGLHLASVMKAWKPVAGWGALPAGHPLRTHFSTSSPFVAACRYGARPTTCFLPIVHTVISIIIDEPTELNPRPGMGSRNTRPGRGGAESAPLPTQLLWKLESSIFMGGCLVEDLYHVQFEWP